MLLLFFGVFFLSLSFLFFFFFFFFRLLINTGSDLRLSVASACFWVQGTEYLQQVTKSAVSAGTWYQRLYFVPVVGKRLPVKTVSRLILSYAALWLRLGHHINADAHRD